MRVRKNTKAFSIWLRKRVVEKGDSVCKIADAIHVGERNIYRHMNGENAPTFPMVVTYCWYFGKGDDPEDIWNLMEEVN